MRTSDKVRALGLGATDELTVVEAYLIALRVRPGLRFDEFLDLFGDAEDGRRVVVLPVDVMRTFADAVGADESGQARVYGDYLDELDARPDLDLYDFLLTTPEFERMPRDDDAADAAEDAIPDEVFGDDETPVVESDADVAELPPLIAELPRARFERARSWLRSGAPVGAGLPDESLDMFIVELPEGLFGVVNVINSAEGVYVDPYVVAGDPEADDAEIFASARLDEAMPTRSLDDPIDFPLTSGRLQRVSLIASNDD